MAETQNSLQLYNIESTDFKYRFGVFEILLNYGANVNAKTDSEETPLHLAVKNNCLEVAQLLIEFDARVDEINRDRRTPLHLSAEFSDSKMAELLLKHCEHKTTVTPVRKDYKIPDCYAANVATLLFKYCKNNADKLHDQIVKEFRNYPFCMPGSDLITNPMLKDCKQFWVWLRSALYKYRSCPYDSDTTRHDTEFESDDIEMRLLKRVREKIVNTTFSNNETPLHRAVESFRRFNDFQMQLVDGKPLFRSGRKSKQQSDLKLRATTENGNKDVTDEDVITKRSDVFTLKLQNPDEYEVLYHRQLPPDFRIDCNQATTLTIISENVKPYVNRKDCEGYNALLKAVEFNQPDIVNLLLRNGTVPCSVNSQGHAALNVAVDLNSIRRQLKSSKPVAIIETLTASGEFNVNALTYKAETPLHLAMSNCFCRRSGKDSDESQRRRETQDSVISVLLKNKANVNQQDCEGMTPLMIASEKGCHHLVKILLASNFVKVDLNARDKYGETALIKAARMHHTDIVNALLNSGARADLKDHRGFTALHSALHDQNEFKSLLKLSKHGSKDTGHGNNNTYEKFLRKFKNKAFARVKGSSNSDKNNLKNTIIAILTRKGLQFQTLDFVNHSTLDFSVKSEIQSTKSALKAQNILSLDKSKNENSVHKKRSLQLDKVDSIWSHDPNWRQKSLLFWLAALCIVTAEHGSRLIQPAVVERIAKVRDNKGRTVLHYAAILSGCGRLPGGGLGLVFKSPELFKTLLMSGCEIDAQDIYRRTPLHYLDTSNNNLLLQLADLIGTKTAAERRLTFGDKLERKDIDGKTMTELWSLRDAGRRRSKIRSNLHKAVKSANIGTTSLDNDTMRILKSGTYDFEKSISWTIWNSDIADYMYAHRNAVTSDLTREMHRFIQRLANTIERKEPWFKCQPVLVGSAFEGTKIDSPDEFDFDFILTKFSDLIEVIPSPVAPEGFVHLRKKSCIILQETDEKRFFDKEGILKTNEISCRFQTVLMQVFQDPSFWDGEPHFESTDAESMMKRFVRCYGRHKNCIDHSDLTDQRLNSSICTTVQLKQTRAIEGMYLLNDISLDLVPCIHVDDWWPHKARSDISDTLKAKGCNLVFDRPQRKYPWVQFGENYARISFAEAESKIIRDSSPTAKAAYMVCKHLIEDKPQMTYVLKTCLLYCIEAIESESEIESERPLDEETDYSSVTPEELSLWVEKLMRCYLVFLLQDFCPCYPMPSLCLPIGDYLKSNHMLLLATDANDYTFLAHEKMSCRYRCCLCKVYNANFNLFRRVCTHDVVIALPKPQLLCDSFNHNDFVLQLRASFG